MKIGENKQYDARSRVMRFIPTFALALAMCAASAGVRPYEFEWANRTKDDRPVLLPLVSTAGWTCETTGATACFTTACERVLFGDGVAHLAYKIPGEKGVIKLKPPAPVPIPPGADTVSLWIWGNHTHYHFREVPWEKRLSISADFLDSTGKPFSVFLHKLNHWNWFLVQRRFAPNVIARVSKGGTFTGFTLRGGSEPAGRWLELTSLAVFKEEFKPLAFKPRRKRGVQIFPNQPQGLNTGEGRLPFPNVETTIIPIVAEDARIEFKLPKDPTKWDDLAVRLVRPTYCSTLVVSGEKTASVQQQDGWIHFAKGGGLFPVAATKGAKVRFHRIANSLVADVEAPVGVEEVRFGCMEKPDEVAFTPVPYYTGGGNGDGVYRRPCVVTAGKGDGRLFLLASVDWTQSNASWVFPTNHPVPVASNGGVKYLPKTDGTRNPVFERFVWSFSTNFAEVLPNIPNPSSPWRAVTTERQWSVMHANNREKDKAFWRGQRGRCPARCGRTGSVSTFPSRPTARTSTPTESIPTRRMAARTGGCIVSSRRVVLKRCSCAVERRSSFHTRRSQSRCSTQKARRSVLCHLRWRAGVLGSRQ